MSEAVFMVGDVRARMAELPDGHFDLILTSPPFLALRSYLPDGHPDKAFEIGSEATPAAYLDTLLELTAEWGRLLAPHGSIAIELGDTYAGSGGAGGDYQPDGLHEGQPRFRQVGSREHRPQREGTGADGGERVVPLNGGPGWPLDKSLTCIPQLYMVALAYGINPLTGQPSPAGRWRIRNLKPWIRSNPPVGALGDKERPATSYVVVACRARDRWFDLDAVRTTAQPQGPKNTNGPKSKAKCSPSTGFGDDAGFDVRTNSNAGGAPPRDWWHHVDAVLDTELANRASEGPRHSTSGRDNKHLRRFDEYDAPNPGAQGVHLRRALERAGILTTLDALDVSPRGYSGAHYAVWPPELVRLVVDEMCPRQVCTICGAPRRRITERSERYAAARDAIGDFNNRGRDGKGVSGSRSVLSKAAGANMTSAENVTVGWSDCGCLPQSPVGEETESGETGSTRPTDHAAPWPPTSPTPGRWRPGRILDPFVGSGTTLAVATGMARDAIGIDLDPRNAHLAAERVGMFLTVDHGVPL